MELVLSTAQASEHLALQQFDLCFFPSSELLKSACAASHPFILPQQIPPNVCLHHLLTD